LNKQTLYTELSIQIAVLEAKVDKVLQLLMEPEVEYQIKPVMVNLKGQVEHFNNNPPQWPNESHTDYLKRIGQYNEAQSDDEFYGEVYK
jgi:hypothetical protein